MAKVRSRNTRPELRVRSVLHRMGFRFRVNRRDLPGTPDIVLPRLRTVIFVHGCFWHSHEGCRRARIPSSNVEYWTAKLQRNLERDKLAVKAVEKLGWHVHVIWECQTPPTANLEETLRALLSPEAKE